MKYEPLLKQALTELETVGDWLRWCVSTFERVPLHYGHGADNAWDEAVMLLFPLLHLPFDVLPQVLNAKLMHHEKESLVKALDQRIRLRVPSAYITHQAWFAGKKYYVDKRVLIPRSPLAEIIQSRFSPWLPDDLPVYNILDIGTGSGCIACACAFAFPEAQVDAVDISPETFEVAKMNVENYGLNDRVHLIRSNIFSELKNKRYDIIISNPPYVDNQEMENLPLEYQHEPHLGLASGKDGLDCVRVILEEAKNHLTDEGILIVEVGYSAAALSDAFPSIPFTWIDLEQGGEGVFMLSAKDLSLA